MPTNLNKYFTALSLAILICDDVLILMQVLE